MEVTFADGKILVGYGSTYVDGPQYVIIDIVEHAFVLSTYDYKRGYDGWHCRIRQSADIELVQTSPLRIVNYGYIRRFDHAFQPLGPFLGPFNSSLRLKWHDNIYR